MKPLKHTKVILCEGIEDAATIRALFDARALPRTCDVRPVVDIGGSGGDGAFARAFSSIDTDSSFDPVTKVMVVADNDDDPVAKFQNVLAQLEKARKDYGLTRNWAKPMQPGVLAKGEPAVVVWMWPGPGAVGCLETLLWKAIVSAFPAPAGCVTAAAACTGADGWSISKRDKSAVRCYFALSCQVNPSLTLTSAWNDQATSQLIPLTDPSLDPFVNFLSQF